MTFEELTKLAQEEFKTKVPMPCYVVGAQWAYELLQKQHKEDISGLLTALESIANGENGALYANDIVCEHKARMRKE